MSRSRQNSDSKNSAGSDSKIVEGEKVLCYHGSLIYEAKCLKIRESTDDQDKLEYFIHYAGWSKKWEEWVGESRILKYSEENVKKQQNLKDAESKGTKKGTPHRKSSTTEKDKDSGSSRPCSPAVSVKSNKSNQDTPSRDEKDVTELSDAKKKRSSTAVTEVADAKKKKSSTAVPVKEKEVVAPVEKEKIASKDKEKEKEVNEEPVVDESKVEETPIKPEREVMIALPEKLYRCAYNDMKFITVSQFLTTVPAEITIKQVFDDYLESKGSDLACALHEFIIGLQHNIDEALAVKLLYKFEKPQYKAIKESHPNVPMHKLYGPIHLLRLLACLDVHLSKLQLSTKQYKLIEHFANDFLEFLDENYDKYFGGDLYDAATPDYLRLTIK